MRGTVSVSGREGADLVAATRQRLLELGDEAEGRIARVHTAAMGDVMRDYLEQLRADVAAGGFYQAAKLSKTWRGAVYPPNGRSMTPAAYFFNKAGDILEAFSLGLTIEAAGGRFLAIPVGPAKALVRKLQRRITGRGYSGFGKSGRQFESQGSTVERVAQALGVRKLELRPTAKGGFVLVAPGRSLTATGRDARRGGGDTVLFVLARTAKLKKRIEGLALVAKLQKSALADFERAVAEELGVEAIR